MNAARKDSRPPVRHRDSVDIVMEGGNPLPPLFMPVPDKSALKQGSLGEDLGQRSLGASAIWRTS